MSDVLIRGLDVKALQRLKARAKRHGRSLQSEAKLILEQAAGQADLAAILRQWRQRFLGRIFSDSAALIRQDRRR